jgi:hypothetical protein
VITAAAARIIKPAVEKLEMKIDRLLTLLVAAASDLRIVGQKEPFRKRPMTDLAGNF